MSLNVEMLIVMSVVLLVGVISATAGAMSPMLF